MRKTDEGRREEFHGKRAMLNRPGHYTTAAIVAEVEDTSTWGYEARKYRYNMPEITLQIANCDRSIAFDVDVVDRDYKNDLHKVNLMISALTAFREGLVIERKRWLERQREFKWDDNDD